MTIGSKCHLMTTNDRLDFHEIHMILNEDIQKNLFYFAQNSSINFYVRKKFKIIY